jgi:hypothetical protein
MKKTSIIAGLSICVIGLVVSLAWADDFSFAGISWNDNPDTVIEKINKSEYASHGGTGWSSNSGDKLSLPLCEILIHRNMTDQDKFEFLRKVDKGWLNELQSSKDSTIKQIFFIGKKDSIVKEGSFSFPFKGDTLLAYNIRINTRISKVNEDTGEGQLYQSLIEKYGKPTRRTKYSRVWTKKDQTLYYTAMGDSVTLTYINEKNLSNYIATIERKKKDLEEAGKKKQSDAVRKNF